MISKAISRFKSFSRLVMLPHSLFSLPHAIMVILFSGNRNALRITSVAVALLAARCGANAFNRLADFKFDLLNPRTKNRPLPTHKISKGFALHITLLSFLLFRIAVLFTTPVCIILMPFAILFCIGYSFAKRFTPFCHFWLGLACGLTVLGTYICLAEKISLAIICLYLSLALQVAGFDMLYSAADEEFDRKYGLYSFTASFGIAKMLTTVRFVFFGSVSLLLAFAVLTSTPLLIIAAMPCVFIMKHAIRQVETKNYNVLKFNGLCSIIILLVYSINLLNNLF